MGISLSHQHKMSAKNLKFILAIAIGVVALVDSKELEVTCGDGQIIDLPLDEDFIWHSPGWQEGDEYPENIECKVTFRVAKKHNWNIDSIYDFDVYGDYAKGCEGGDFVQFTINGKKSKKFCGEGTELSDAWCWEDWCWPNTFEVLGNPHEDLLVEAVFKTGTRKPGRGNFSGFEILLSSGYPWDSDEPEANLDGIPMLPMLE